MDNLDLGVSAGASTETAPVELDATSESNETAVASDAEPNEVVERSEGIRNLRNHAKALESDLARYKQEVEQYRPVYEKVSELGGFEALEPLAQIHDAFAVDPDTFRAQHVKDVARQLYNLSPDNFTELAYYLAEQYEPLREMILQSDPDYQAYKASKQEPVVADSDLDPLDPVHAELLRLRKAQKETVEQQTAARQQILEQQAQERVRTLDQKILLSPIQEGLDKLKGWDQSDIESVRALILHELRNDPQYAEPYYKALQNAYDQRAIQLGMDQRLRKLAAAKTAEVIERYGRRLGVEQSQPNRKEVGHTAASTVATPVTNGAKELKIGDPGWSDAVTRELLALYKKGR